jgi:hypothetical protein
MRTGAQGRGFLQVGLRSKVLWGLGLALLVGLSRLEIAGQSVGGAVGRLLVARAEAHKAPSKLPRRLDGRGRAGVFRALELPPLPHAPAFAPFLPATGLAPPPQISAFQLPPLAHAAHTWARIPRRPWAKPHPSGWEAGRGKVASRGDAAASPPPHTPLNAGGWDALVRQAPRAPKMPPPPVQATPSVAAAQAVATPRKSFRRLSEKRTQRRARRAPAAAADVKPRESADKTAAGARHPPRRLGGRSIGELVPPVGSFKPEEVLAVNLTAEGLAKARASGYQVVGQTGLPGLGLTLTHLAPPPTMNAISARERLFDLVPDGGFVLNRVYSFYRLGAGRHDGAGSMPARVGSGCSSERCFGSALIKWQPRLAACARDVKVGMIDTGFDKGHPALAGVRYEYKEFLPEGSAKASPRHGTGVLSLLAGRADSGTPGLIPDASFAIANAFFDDASGQPISDTAQMVRALDWLKRSGVAVANLSFTGPEDDLVHHAVRELTRSGAVVVAAAGNDGPGAPPSYPAAYREVIAVTAVDRNLAAYRYASRGEHIDLAAPGVDIWTAIPGRREGPQTGTSFAVPYVTAVLAVALAGAPPVPDGDALSSKRRALAPLQANIKSLGTAGRDPTFGEGLVQAPASCEPPALAVAASTPPTDPWVGTVLRALDTVTPEPRGLGAWISTVRAAADGLGR